MARSEKEKVKQEIFLMEKFSHPYIVKYIESYIEKERIIIIMENCPGGDLDQLISSHKNSKSFFPENCILDWTGQLASALSHVHALKIIHRDLKPSNVFVALDGKLKLGDFGVSKALADSNDVAMTQIGTPLYLSPEVCNNLPYSFKCDIWALGCVLYELATFKKPFTANSFLALALKIIDQDPDPLPSHYSEKFSTLINKLLSKNPENRPSCKQIFSYLEIKDPYLISHSCTNELFFENSVQELNCDSTLNMTEYYMSDFESDSSEKYEEDFEP